METQRRIDESRAIRYLECRRCHSARGNSCIRLTRTRAVMLEHPHKERMDDLRDLMRDQGGKGW